MRDPTIVPAASRWVSRKGARPNPHRYSPPSISQRQRNEPHRSDDDAPPGEQAEAVMLDIAEKRLHDDPGGNERHRKTEGDDDHVARGHLPVALVEVVGER